MAPPQALRGGRTLVLMPGRLVKQWRQEVEKFLLPGVVDLELWEGQELPAQGRDRRSLLLAPIEVLRKRLRDGQPPVLGRLGLRRLVVAEQYAQLLVEVGGALVEHTA